MTTEDRLYAACWRYVNPTGPAGKAQALNDIRTLVRQLDQEDPTWPNPSTSSSSTTSGTSEPSSQTTDHASMSGSRTTSTRSRTMQTTPAQQQRRSTP